MPTTAYGQSDDRHGNKCLSFESGTGEQKQKYHGHAGVLTLVLWDRLLKKLGKEFAHRSIVTQAIALPAQVADI